MRLRHILLILVLAGVALSARGVVRAQGGNGISSPGDGAVVSGSVQIIGTATLPDFLRYDLHFSANEQDWVYFGSGQAPVVGGVLGYWDTAGARLPDGRYTLRLRVVKTDSQYDEYFVRNVTIANSSPPTAAVTPTSLEQPPTPTPLPTGAVVPGSTYTVTVELPPTRPAATPSPTSKAGTRATPSSGFSIPSISLEGAGSAFTAGVYVTAGMFLIMGSYAFLRSGTGWTARQVRRLLHRRSRRGGG